jgi:hypothetical protein
VLILTLTLAEVVAEGEAVTFPAFAFQEGVTLAEVDTLVLLVIDIFMLGDSLWLGDRDSLGVGLVSGCAPAIPIPTPSQVANKSKTRISPVWELFKYSQPLTTGTRYPLSHQRLYPVAAVATASTRQ